MGENARLRAADALAKAVLAVKRINETQMRTADYHGEGCRCWRCKEDAMFAALDAYETAALTPAPEAPKGGEGENSGWAFDRYINGILMAEGVEVTRPMSFEKASILAAKLASRGPNGEVPVLVLRALPSATQAGGENQALRAMIRVNMLRYGPADLTHEDIDRQIEAAIAAIRAEAEKITSSDAGAGRSPTCAPLGWRGDERAPAPGADSKAGLLRAGKRYLDGHGEVKGPLHAIFWENGEEMLTDSYVVWLPDGTLAGGTREDKRSLVAEVE